MKIAPIVTLGLVSVCIFGCTMTEPLVEQATPNTIAISYEAYDVVPTLSAAAIDIAVEHCKKYNLYANYRGVNVPSIMSAKEIHTFVCEPIKTDDNAVIMAQNRRYAASLPTYTSCNSFGSYTSCTSY